MIPEKKVKLIVDTYEILEKELASGSISKKDFVQKSKEYSSIGEIINQAKSYLSFKNENPELFAPVVKKLIWTTANVIVHAFPGLNRSEAQMLIRLQESLEA